MSFVPAGYYDSEEDDGFYFGDDFDGGQFDESPIEDTKRTNGTNSASLEPSSHIQKSDFEDVSKTTPQGSLNCDISHQAPVKGGSGNPMSSNSCSDISQESSAPRHGNPSRGDGGMSHDTTPVKFAISVEQLDSSSPEESKSYRDPVGQEHKPFSSFGKALNGFSSSKSQDRLGSRNQVKQLEALEDMRVALFRGNIEQVQKLLDEGFDPDAPLSSGWPPLLHACDSCQQSIVKLLLDRGANPNASKDLLTALMVACMKNSHYLQDKAQACVRVLLEKGARVNARDRHHMTPLLYACQGSQTGLAELLISAEADVNAKDVRGWTPLLYAAEKGHAPLLHLLVKAGADPKATNVQLETPASVAYSSGHVAVADWLEAVVALKRDGEGSLAPDLPPPSLFESSFSSTPNSKTAQGAASSDQPTSSSLATPSDSTLPSSTTILGDLEMFLMGLQLSELVPLFRNHRVEFGQLLSMTDSDLQKMGVARVGHRKKILNGVLEVHKREWAMPDDPLPYGRPISSAELTVIVSNLSCHAQYVQGTAHFLLTHIRSSPDLLGPHVEPSEAKKLTVKLAEAVGAAQKLGAEMAALKMVAERNLPRDVVATSKHKTSPSPRRWSLKRKKTLYFVLGLGITSCLSYSIYRFLTH